MVCSVILSLLKEGKELEAVWNQVYMYLSLTCVSAHRSAKYCHYNKHKRCVSACCAVTVICFKQAKSTHILQVIDRTSGLSSVC